MLGTPTTSKLIGRDTRRKAKPWSQTREKPVSVLVTQEIERGGEAPEEGQHLSCTPANGLVMIK